MTAMDMEFQQGQNYYMQCFLLCCSEKLYKSVLLRFVVLDMYVTIAASVRLCVLFNPLPTNDAYIILS